MPICGIEKLYVAKQLTDTSVGMTYETPQYYKDVQQLDIKPKTNTSPGYAGNRLIDQATMFDSSDIAVNRYSMSSAERAYVLGQTIAADGGVVGALGDEPPFIALLYKAPIRVDGKVYYRYGVIYKVLFMPPDDSMKGLEGKPDLSQVPKLSGTAQPTEWNFKDGNTEKHPWEYHVDTCDPNCPADIDSTWFTSVKVPGADTVVPTVATVPVDGASGVAVGADVVFTFSKAIDINTMIDSNIFLMKADGTPVVSTLSVNAANTVVTLNPDADITAGDYVAICTKNVKSATGLALAANKITNFTV